MNKKSIIIIGAGLAGLSTGCYSQMNGYQTHIFEHHTMPGGVATCWKRKGYIIDGGIHFLMCHKPGQSIYEIYANWYSSVNRFLDMTSYCRFIDEASGRSVQITRDLDLLAKELKAVSPADSRFIDDLVTGARAMQGTDIGEMGMSQPQELLGFPDKLKQMWKMRRFFKYFTGKYAGSAANYAKGIHDPWLRYIFENMFLPEVPIWFILMLLGMLADGQMGCWKGVRSTLSFLSKSGTGNWAGRRLTGLL